MLRVMIAVGVLAAGDATARAETIELGAAFLAGSETSSPRSGGHRGGLATVAVWSGRVGGVLEAGYEEWDPDALTWVGIGGRLGLRESSRVCARPLTQPEPSCFEFRPWIGGGLLHETWSWETYGFDRERGRFERNAYYLGAGFDTNVGALGSTLFFRVQRGRVPDTVPVMEIHDAPYETSLVFGLGLGYVGN